MRNIVVLIIVLSLTLFCYSLISAIGTEAPVIVHDRYNIPMVFIPSGSVRVGATLDEAAEKCESLQIRPSPWVRDGVCRLRLLNAVPDGIAFFVTPIDKREFEDFFIDQYEVTLQAYQTCVDEGVCNREVIQYLQDYFPSITLEAPVDHISYLDAETFCTWRGGYIPSEAEWEYAARGKDRLPFPWGNEFDGSIVNFCDANCVGLPDERWDDGFADIAPINAHPNDISWAGAVGMAGNVSEWTSTIYTSPNITTASNKIIQRVVKGGSYATQADQMMLWRRFPMGEIEIRPGIGFRCAKRL